MKKYIILFILLFGAGIAISDIDTFEGTATDSLSDIEGSTVAAEGGDTISYRAGSGTNGYTDPGSITLTKPSGTVEGDMMIVLITDDATGNALTCSGWTAISETDNQARVSAFYKEAGGSEPADYTFTAAGAGRGFAGVIGSFSKTGGTWDASAITTNDTTNTGAVASLTTTSITCVDSSILICGFGNDSAFTVSVAPADMTIVDAAQVGNSVAAAMYYEARDSGGVTKSITWSSTDGNVGVSLYLSLQ
jgi:hypothetical protein